MKKKILIIDDDMDVQDILKTTLERAGYQVYSAMDAMQGPMMARQVQPDLVILDIMMPRLNGFQVARMIKFDKQLKHTKVVVLTARTQPADRKLSKEVGADEYMTKPFDPQQLLDRINYWLKT